MSKMFDGKVVLITGAARSQGRSHAVRFAEEGADVIALDICSQIDTVNYPMAAPSDLERTAQLVETAGGRVVAEQVDVRDVSALMSAVQRGTAELGALDFVLANAGIMPGVGDIGAGLPAFDDAIDVLLKGVYYTVEAALPSLLEKDNGGAIVITGSAVAQKAVLSPSFRTLNSGAAGYTAAKAGLVGLMHHYARALAERNIRVNTVHPTGVATPMVTDPVVEAYWATYPEIGAAVAGALPGVGLIESADVTNAVVYLCSESGRYVTGVALPVDAGFLLQ